MNFTREPIIETIITPKDGYKLVIRNSKAGGGEEYSVDSVEIVSFGSALFFRSTERPKPFLVPVTDFEVVESKETRVVLKSATFERSIKIGGGKEASLKAGKEKQEEPEQVEQRLEKKRERRRHRRRRGSAQAEDETPQPAEEKPAPEGGGAEDETQVSSSPVSRLIPPPSGLISDKYPKNGEEAAAPVEGDVLPEPVEAKEDAVKEEKPKRTRRRKKAEPKAAKKKEEVTTEEETSAAEAKEEVTPKAEAEDAAKAQVEEKPTDSLPKSEEAEPPAPSAEEGGDVNRVAIEQQETVTSTSFSAFDTTGGEPFGKIW